MEKLESAKTLQADKKKEQRSFQKCHNELLKNTTVSITPHYPVNRDFLPVTNRTGQRSVCQEHAGSYICGSPTYPLCLSPMMLTFLYLLFLGYAAGRREGPYEGLKRTLVRTQKQQVELKGNPGY